MFHVEQRWERQLVEGGGTLRAQHLPVREDAAGGSGGCMEPRYGQLSGRGLDPAGALYPGLPAISGRAVHEHSGTSRTIKGRGMDKPFPSRPT